MKGIRASTSDTLHIAHHKLGHTLPTVVLLKMGIKPRRLCAKGLKGTYQKLQTQEWTGAAFHMLYTNQSEFYENPQKNDSNNYEEKVVAPIIKVVPGNMELIEYSGSDGFPGVLARHCLHLYGNKVNEKRVRIHIAKEILKGAERFAILFREAKLGMERTLY
ncbi:hypothetical protein VNO77_20066 [Canavalia gladiata]|uniref:Uncharacterized protein n=1 Tax=Canavalia gladiata TaxID=3824 RepID=A0AAN9LNT6_CANGL